MTTQEAVDLYAYNDWANARLLACAAELPPEQWSRDLGGAFPTVLGVVAHIVAAEWIWLRRWQGHSPPVGPPWLAALSQDAVEGALAEIEADRAEFLGALSDSDLEGTIHYTLLDGSAGSLPLATLLQHTLNHSTYHRGQLASMLRRLGTTPPATDLVLHAVQRDP
jgi:uncharacterized damage-inducible protein DinB